MGGSHPVGELITGGRVAGHSFQEIKKRDGSTCRNHMNIIFVWICWRGFHDDGSVVFMSRGLFLDQNWVKPSYISYHMQL